MAGKQSRVKFQLGSFDLIKGIGIILFIISHSFSRYAYDQSSVLSVIVYGLLPAGIGIRSAFYVIGGIMFRETSPSKMLKKTFQSLLVPYLWVMAAYAFLFPLVRYPFMPSWREVFTYAIRYVVAFLFGNIEYGKVIFGFEMYWCTPMYFFLSMFIAMNIFNLILKYKNKYGQLALVALCVVIGTIMLSKKMYLFSLAYGLPAVGFYYVGYLLSQNNLFRKLQNNKWIYIPLIGAFLLGYKLNLIVQPDLLVNLIICFTSLATALLFLFVCDYITDKEWDGLGWLKKCGAYSYWVICIHSFETEAIPWFLYVQRFPASTHLLAFVLEMAIKVIIISAGCMILKKIMNWRYRRKMSAYRKQKIS